MDLSTILIIIGVLFFGWIAVLTSWSESEEKKVLDTLSARYPGAKIHRSFTGDYIAIDYKTEVIALSTGGREAKFAFPNLLAVELVQDDNTLSVTNRGSQALGAAVGGVAFGGAGLILGGLSASKRTLRTVGKISLKLQTEDLHRPYHEVVFFRAHNPTKGEPHDSVLVRSASDTGNEFHAALANIIRMEDRKRASKIATQTTAIQEQAASGPVPPSEAAQIRELWDLKEMGAITLEEFELKKADILKK